MTTATTVTTATDKPERLCPTCHAALADDDPGVLSPAQCTPVAVGHQRDEIRFLKAEREMARQEASKAWAQVRKLREELDAATAEFGKLSNKGRK